jgi:hypothetical protein
MTSSTAQIKKLLHVKGNNYQSKKTALRMGQKPLPFIHLTED